jgi:ATP-binding cassette subfamily C protein CydD
MPVPPESAALQTAPSAPPSPEVWLKSFKPRLKRQLNLAVGLGLASGMLLVAQAGLFAWAISTGVMHKTPLSNLWPWLLALLPIFALRFALVRASERVAFQAGAQLRQDLRAQLLGHIQRLGPVWLHGQARGDLVNSVVNGVEALEGYYARYLPTMSITALVPLAILVAVFPADWISGLVLLLTAPLIPFFMWMIGKGTEELNQKQWRKLAYLSARFLDTLQGLTTLKLLGASRREAAVVAQVSDDYRTSTMQVLRVAFLSSVVLEFLSTASIALVAVLIGFRLMWGDLLFFPGLFVLLLAPEYYAPLRNTGTVYHLRMEAIGAAERMVQVLQTPLPVVRAAPPESPIALSSSSRASGQDQRSWARGAAGRASDSHGSAGLPPSLTFDAVHFAYAPGRPALAGCSFTAPAGKVTAIVGASGAGKSTVLNLLLGFVQAQQGSIRADGVELAAMDEAAWLAQIAWVPQQPHVFSGTVVDNIRLGRSDATLQQVEQAARAAQADGFIRTLPQGYTTPLGERGAGLSGGQVQRLALARAFLKDAPVLVLDEATANLDAHSQEAVMRALAELAHGRTVLMLAHRLRTLALAEHIVVLDAGRVVEAGTRDELQHAGGAFARMLRTGGELA